MNDLKFALRQLLKNPGFTAVAVLTLGICLGATLSIFAVVDAILLRSLPFPEPDRLVTPIKAYPLSGVPRARSSVADYYASREHIKAFASCAIVQSRSAIVDDGDGARRVPRDRISPEFFSTLRVPLLMGRSFTDEEMLTTQSVAVLTHNFWQHYFNADPKVLGRTFAVDGVPLTVVGVLPAGYRYLSSKAQFYTPAASNPGDRVPTRRHGNNEFELIARLAPAATLASAQAEVDALNAVHLKDDPFAPTLKSQGFITRVKPLHAEHVESIKPTLLLLQGGVLFLLLIGGVNLVNLLLIRASSRAKELAVRQALGASRRHVVSQVMTEIVLLTLLGGLTGLAVAAGAIRLLPVLGAEQLPLGAYVTFDGRLAMTALLGGVVLGIVIAGPVAWFNLHRHPAHALQSDARGGTASHAAQKLRHGFIVAQIVLAFVLLTGAGLLGVSLKRVLETSPGFQAEHVLTAQLSLPRNNYQNTTARLDLLERLLPAIQNQPGVSAVAIGTSMPFGGDNNSGSVSLEGVLGELRHAHRRNGVAGDYWRAMGIPLLEGRFLEDADNRGAQRVCVIDQDFARRYWPGESALGRRLSNGAKFDDAQASTIVGVVGSVKHNDLSDTQPLGMVYYPFSQWPGLNFSVIVRSSLAPVTLAPQLRKAVQQLDPALPLDDIKPMQTRLDDSLVTRRSPALLAGIFAATALLLAAVGIYGVLAFAVAQRRREIGVRMALGALPRQVLAQFIGLGARLLLIGITLGVLGAWAIGRAMQNVLFSVGAIHAGVLATTAGVMMFVVLLAVILPSRRAAKTDPMEALRSE
jgi:predicted permease